MCEVWKRITFIILPRVDDLLKRVKSAIDSFVGCYTHTPSKYSQTLIYDTWTSNSIRYHDVNEALLLFVCQFQLLIEINLQQAVCQAT